MPVKDILPSWTVNEVIQRYPASVAVFGAFRIDACCGGAKPLEEVARRHDIELDALLDALDGVAAGEDEAA